jgi:hypothetical protein
MEISSHTFQPLQQEVVTEGTVSFDSELLEARWSVNCLASCDDHVAAILTCRGDQRYTIHIS